MSEPQAERRLLVVEDEAHLAAGLRLNFEFEGFAVDVATTAREALAFLARPAPYAAIVLDVSLPDMDGFEVCRRLRRAGNYTPVIMLTARNAATDRVQGLESGSDDYLTKPFELDELMARLRSMLRRRAWEQQQGSPRAGAGLFRFGEVEIDFETHECRAFGQDVRLTTLELDLVRYFAENPHRVISRAELMERVWKLGNYPNSRTMDNFVLRLRRHFEADPQDPQHFLSVRGAGYKFVPEPEARG
jgi:DNA-binding response OmpR family regulator